MGYDGILFILIFKKIDFMSVILMLVIQYRDMYVGHMHLVVGFWRRS